MFWGFGLNGKTVKELRKNQGLTAKELAQMVKVEPVEILKIEEMRLKDVPETLRKRIAPILKGKQLDKIPW